MKTNHNFGLLYVLLVICQIVIYNFNGLDPYVMLTMLPVMILCIPTGISTISCLLIAFVSGLSADWLSEGLLGINAAALLPVALLRKGIIRIFLGEDLIARNDSFSIRKNGLAKVSWAMVAATSLFLITYIILDGAGTRPFWFCLMKFVASLACNWFLGILVVNTLTVNDRR